MVRRRDEDVCDGQRHGAVALDGAPPVPIRWVLLRDPTSELKPIVLSCTDHSETPRQFVTWYVGGGRARSRSTRAAVTSRGVTKRKMYTNVRDVQTAANDAGEERHP